MIIKLAIFYNSNNFKRKLFLTGVCLCLPLLALGSVKSSNKLPNIVIIMTDDQRWDSLSCYGDKVVKTPNIDATQLGKIEFTARGAKIEYDCSKQELIVNDLHAEAPKINGRQNIIIYVDKTMLEVFASDGLIYMPIPYIPSKDNLSIKLTDENHILKLSDIKVYRLKSIWE